MDRVKVLFLTHRLPYAPNRGDRIRAYHTLHVLRRRFRVDLLSLVHDAEEASHASALRDVADDVQIARVPRARNYVAGSCRLAGSTPLTHVLLDSPTVARSLRRAVNERRPDVVLAYCSGMARFALQPPLAGVPLVIDMVDVDSCKWKAMGETALPPMRWIYRREAACLSAFEARAAQRAFATVVVNDREASALSQIVPGARVEVVPSGVDLEHLRPRSAPSTGREVVFCGVMNYAPNEQGAIWLAREVWPLVLRRFPDAHLTLVGANPTARVRRLAAAGPGITVTGSVPDVRPYLWRSAVAVAPLQLARGVQNKVLEAVAAALPAVVTPVVADGLPAEVLGACRLASTAETFAHEVGDLLARSPDERRAIAREAKLDVLSWQRRLGALAGLLEAAAARRH